MMGVIFFLVMALMGWFSAFVYPDYLEHKEKMARIKRNGEQKMGIEK